MKKITLNKETLRSLDDHQMDMVHGGATATCGCSTSPGCSMKCPAHPGAG